MDTATAGHAPLSRTLLPLLAAVVLIALIFVLPQREAVAPAQLDPLDLPRLQVDQPPDWTRQHGDAPILRQLDRLVWAGNASLTATLQSLHAARGTLAPELLRRLSAIGTGDPVLAAKLIAVLGDEDASQPGVAAELVKQALSEHPLPAKAALRALADVNDRQALDGILPRLLDPDLDVQSYARGALAGRARGGDVEAQGVVLAELAEQPADPDLAFLTVVEAFADSEQALDVLHAVAASAAGGARLVALTTLRQRDDPLASAAFETMLAGSDAEARTHAWRSLHLAQRVSGQSRWPELIGTTNRTELLAMAQVMMVAVDTNHPDRGLALDLALGLASDRTNAVHDDIIAALYVRRHPWAEEITREELRTLVGPPLGTTVDRIIDARYAPPGFVELALGRIADPVLRDEDRLLLCRLLAHFAPERAADAIVRFALDVMGRNAVLGREALVLLPLLGAPGLERLLQEAHTPLGRDVFLRVAADGGHPAALPGLRQIALDATQPELPRFFALDCVVRIKAGPREEVLREVVAGWPDPRVRDRAQLLFWNYL